MIVSGISDGCLLFAPLWWAFVEGGFDMADPSARATAMEQVGVALGIVPLTRLASLLVTAPFGDWFSRKQVLAASFLARCLIWGSLALASLKGFDSPRITVLLALAAVGSGLSDSVSLGMVPQLVTPANAKRALAYSAGLPKMGFFLSIAAGLIVSGLAGLTGLLLLGVLWLAAAGFAASRVRAATPVTSPPLHLGLWGAELLLPLTQLFRQRSLLWLGLIAALTNFVAYPMYSISAALQADRPEGLGTPESLEWAFAIGALAGALAVGWVTHHYDLRRTTSACLAVFGAGVAALCWAGPEWASDAVSFAAGAAFSILNVQLVTRALGLAPERMRVRAAALMAASFAAGAELGARAISEASRHFDVRWVLGAVALATLAQSALVAGRPGASTFDETFAVQGDRI